MPAHNPEESCQPSGVESAVSTTADAAIEALAHSMVGMPEPDIREEMYFADGLVAKELWRAAGTVIVGMKHKKESIAFLLSGSMRVWDEDNGPRDIHAPSTWVRPAGVQQVSLALTDSMFTCVHASNAKSEEEAARDVIEEDSLEFKRRFAELRKARELAA